MRQKRLPALAVQAGTRPRPNARTHQWRYDMLMAALEEHYPRVMRKGTFKSFGRDIWDGKYGNIHSEQFVQELIELAESGSEMFPKEPQARARLVALVAATAYCNLAINAAWSIRDPSNDDPEWDIEADAEDEWEAWNFAVNAGQWEGMLTGLLNSSVDAVRQFALRGAEARSENLQRVKDEAVRLYRAGKWKSVRDAALKIHDAVREFGARENLHSLAPSNSFRTVYDWLRECGSPPT